MTTDGRERFQEWPCILIGEDDTRTSKDLRRVLSSRAHLIRARSSEQLLRLARSEPTPTLIIMVATSADIDGYEVCRALKGDEATCSIPILLLRTARAKEPKARVFEVGASDFVIKPIDEATLAARVETHLELNRLQRLASTSLALDALTEVADKRGVVEFIELEWGRAAREATPLSLVMIRIDDFDDLVKKQGRHISDECLRQIVGELLNAIRRPMDFLGRYDEDTFAVVLPVTAAYGASYLAERMCEQVELLEFPHPGTTEPGIVTVSAGVATTSPYPGSSPTPLIQAALEGLSLACRQGGNCVRRFESVEL